MRKFFPVLVVLLAVSLVTGCGLRRKKYETPIATDSNQPDKTLFDKAVNDLEKSRFDVARLTLQTLIATYPDSEYLAKAKLAIADAWYREGGSAGLAQAELEYKDFITFFPMMAEAAEAQLKVAMIHYYQMEKASRDTTHAQRAEQEFKQLLLQFSDSPFTVEAKQRLMEVQEVLAAHEFDVGRHYFQTRGNARAAISRLEELTVNFPYYSQADEALWILGQSYEKGTEKEHRRKAAEAYAKIVSDYPLSPLVEEAKGKLVAWEMPVPDAKPEAYARMKYDLEHREEKGLIWKTTGWMRKRPDVSMASKAGEPVLTPRQRPEPPAAGSDVSVEAAGPGNSGLQLETVQPGGSSAPAGSSAPTPPPARK